METQDEMWVSVIGEAMERGIKTYRVPSHTFEGLRNYVLYGLSPGSFVYSVLTNNLVEAVGRADHFNLLALKEIVGFMYNHIPANSWGSEEQVEEYMNWRQEMREKSLFKDIEV